METVTDFIFLGSKIITDGDCNHEMKRHLIALWKKSWGCKESDTTELNLEEKL